MCCKGSDFKCIVQICGVDFFTLEGEWHPRTARVQEGGVLSPPRRFALRRGYDSVSPFAMLRVEV